MKPFLFLLAFFLTVGCTKTAPPADAPSVEPAKPDLSLVIEIPGFKPEWSKAAHKLVGENLLKLNKASSDMSARFCPKFASLSEAQQITVWVHLMSAIWRYESGPNPPKPYFKTDVVFKESNGVNSEGAFQLSYGDSFCPKKKAEGDLHDPLVNMDCAVKLMASFTDKDSVVAAGGYTAYGASSPKGLARYWAVIRVPDPKPHRNSKGEMVRSDHKLKEIIDLTRKAPGCV